MPAPRTCAFRLNKAEGAFETYEEARHSSWLWTAGRFNEAAAIAKNARLKAERSSENRPRRPEGEVLSFGAWVAQLSKLYEHRLETCATEIWT
jgi:hypothetical protein